MSVLPTQPSKRPPADSFIVIARTRAVLESDGLAGCSILPFGSLYPAIYSQVFGPGSHKACEQFVSEHCGSPNERFKPSGRGPGETMIHLNERIESCLDEALFALTPREQVEAVERCLLDVHKIALGEDDVEQMAGDFREGEKDRAVEFKARMKGTVDTIKDLIVGGGIPVNIPNLGTVHIRPEPVFAPQTVGIGGGGVRQIGGVRIVITYPL